MWDLVGLIKAAGYLGLFGIVFAESGLLVGFFLPGDSLLFTAGLLAAQGSLRLDILIILTFIAAVTGDSVGYTFGAKFGHKIFKRENSRLFHQDNLEKAKKFYEKHGPLTIVLARFTPFIRTFAPILAGVGKMDYRLFLTYNLAGGFLWTVGLTTAGFYLGQLVPNLDRFLLPIILLIILLSLLPSLTAWRRARLSDRSGGAGNSGRTVA